MNKYGSVEVKIREIYGMLDEYRKILEVADKDFQADIGGAKIRLPQDKIDALNKEVDELTRRIKGAVSSLPQTL